MKQTIAELKIGGEGWIIYNDFALSPRIVNITVVDIWKQDGELGTLMPEYLVIENTTKKDLYVFANHIVYSTKEEAEEEFATKYFHESEQLDKEINALNQPTLKYADLKKLAAELEHIQKQFEYVAEDQKKDFCTFTKKIRNIADPQPDDTNWKQVRIDAAISILNSLLETTKHSVLEEVAVNEVYAKTAVAYADALVKELKRSEAYFEEKLKEI